MIQVLSVVRCPTLLFLPLLVVSCSMPQPTNSADSVVHVSWTPSPEDFTYDIDGQPAGTDLDAVITTLTNQGVRKIIFESWYKMQDAEESTYYADFTNAGIVLLEFWVPTSQPPPMTDMSKHHPKKSSSGDAGATVSVHAACGPEPNPSTTYYVAGQRVTSTEELVGFLTTNSVRGIVFTADFRMDAVAAEHYIRLFRTSGIEVDAFWVPDQEPGRIDLMRGRWKKTD